MITDDYKILQALFPGIVAAHVDEESRLRTPEASESHHAEHLATCALEGEEA